MNDIGKFIKEIREKNGFSKTAFAEEFGLTYNHIYKIERGIAKPSIDVVRKICVRFNENLETGLEKLKGDK